MESTNIRNQQWKNIEQTLSFPISRKSLSNEKHTVDIKEMLKIAGFPVVEMAREIYPYKRN